MKSSEIRARKRPSVMSRICLAMLAITLAGVGTFGADIWKGPAAPPWLVESFEGTPGSMWGGHCVSTDEAGAPPGGGLKACRQIWNQGEDTGFMSLNFAKVKGMPAKFGDGSEFYMRYFLKYDANFDFGASTGFKQIIIQGNSIVHDRLYFCLLGREARLALIFQTTKDTSWLHANVNGGAFSMPKDRWVEFEWYIKVSPESEKKGVVKGWVDGKLRWDYSGIATIQSGSYTALSLNTTFNQAIKGPNQKRYWDLFSMGPALMGSARPPSRHIVRLPDEKKLWEPWVDTAVIGDRVVRGYSSLGYRERREVTAVDDKSVTLIIKRTYDKAIFRDGSDVIWRRIHSRTRYPALEKFYANFKIDQGDRIQGVVVKSKPMLCGPIPNAGIITGYSIKDGALTITEKVRCMIWVHKDIPLGGIAKRLKWAPSPFSKADDRKPKGRLQFEFVLEDFARGDGRPSAPLLQMYRAARASLTAPVAVRREVPKGKALPEQLVGWRGDGSGRFDDCDPPIRWGRISKTMKGLRTQATKPKGEGPGEESSPILHGTVRDWLVLYPVPAEGSDKELARKDLIPDEAKLQPDSGDKVGELQWQPVRVEGSGLYFNRILANARSLKDQAVYVHAYIHAPSARHVFMWMRSAAPAKVLLNGEELKYGSGKKAVRVQLKQGWNRMLARVLSTRKKGKGVAIRVNPAGSASFQLEMSGAEADEDYEESGILWTVEPPQAGQPSYFHPIIVGDRLYVASSPAFLVCYDKLTGKRLWVRDNGFWEFFTSEERKAHPELFKEIDPKVKRFNEIAESYGGTLDEHEELGRLHKELVKLLRKVDPVKYACPTRRQEAGLASQPVSDGKYVYTWSFLGIAACYDPDGNRKWMTLSPEGPQPKHSYELAPMLVGRDMVVAMRSIIGFDRETGKVSWKIPGSGSIYHRDGQARKGSLTDAVNYDGLGLYKPGLGFFPWSHTTREGNMLYRIDHNGIVGRRSTLPDPLTEAPKLKEWGPDTWFMPANDVIYLPGTYRRSSLVQGNPLFHKGLIYTISTGGVLRVQEYGRRKYLYSRLVGLNQVIGGLQPRNAGVCASPTQAGDYVYLFGADGTTLVIKAGPKYELVARNRIERMLPPPRLVWGKRRSAEEMVSGRRSEVTISSPIFDGKRLYYRAERHLYCIGKE